MQKKSRLQAAARAAYILLVAAMLFLFFTTDFGLVDIHKTSIVVAVGIDVTEDGYDVTAQAAIPTPAQGGGSASYTQVTGSGATVAALRLSGVPRSRAAELSFLLSVPVIAGSALYEGTELAVTGGLGDVSVLPLLCGMAAAFVAGCVAIRFFLSLVRTRSSLPFALYTAALAVVSFFIL